MHRLLFAALMAVAIPVAGSDDLWSQRMLHTQSKVTAGAGDS
jgi:hypothetical protein